MKLFQWPRKKRRILNSILGLHVILLLACATALFFQKPLAHSRLAQETNKHQVGHVPKATLDANQKADKVNTGEIKDGQPVTSEPVFDWNQVHAFSPDMILNNNYDASQLPIIAGIAIPDLGINLPIYKGVSDANLIYGAGTTSDNEHLGEGNYGLASHHVFGMWGDTTLLFSPLDRAQNGQKIYTTDKTYIYVYDIYNKQRVSPEDSYLLDPISENETPIITLVTCTDIHATARLIVQGRLKDKIPYDSASDTIKSYFFAKYNAYQR